jgi:PST family polysaccharide transporter
MIPAARILGPSTLGKVAVVVVLIPIFSDLIDFGGGFFLSRNLKKMQYSKRELENYFIKKIKLSFLLIVPWVITVLIFKINFALILPSTLLLILANILSLFNTTNQQIAIATGDANKAAYGLLIERLGWSTFFLLVQVGSNSIVIFFVSTMLGYLGQALYLYLNIFKVNFQEISDDIRVSEVKFSDYSEIGLKSLITNSYLLNQILVTTIAGSASGGIFNAAYRLRNLMVIGYSSVSWSITSYLLRDSSEKNFRKTLHVNRFTLIVNSLGLISLFIFAHTIFHIAFGNEYNQSIPVFRLLCVTQLLNMIPILITNFLMCNNKERALRRLMSKLVPLTLIAEATGAYIDGARGAAVGTLLATFVTAFLHIQYFKLFAKNRL